MKRLLACACLILLPAFVGPSSFAGAVLGVILGTSCTFSGATHTFSTAGSSTETIPACASSLTVEAWGGSGGGGSGGSTNGGGGGASGGYSKTIISVVGSSLKTISVTVGSAGVHAGADGGATTVSSGTFTITTMTSNGGATGASGAISGAGGAGGTASGGSTTNTTGNNGGNHSGSGGGAGGAGLAGTNGTGATGGTGGNAPSVVGTDGGAGLVIFKYT